MTKIYVDCTVIYCWETRCVCCRLELVTTWPMCFSATQPSPCCQMTAVGDDTGPTMIPERTTLKITDQVDGLSGTRMLQTCGTASADWSCPGAALLRTPPSLVAFILSSEPALDVALSAVVAVGVPAVADRGSGMRARSARGARGGLGRERPRRGARARRAADGVRRPQVAARHPWDRAGPAGEARGECAAASVAPVHSVITHDVA